MTISSANIQAFTTVKAEPTSSKSQAQQASFTASTSRGFDSGFEKTFAAIEKFFSSNANRGQATVKNPLSGIELSGSLSKWLGVGAKPATGISQLN